MNKITFVFFLSLFSTLSFANSRCDISFDQNKVCAQLDWIYGPYFDQNNSAKISIDPSAAFDSIKVIPWMVMMGGHEHGSRPVKLTAQGANEFLIENAYFMGGMSGEWYFKIQLLKNNSVIEEKRTKITMKP